jgi:hypothetical protein
MRNWPRFVRLALSRIFPRLFRLQRRPIRRGDPNRFAPTLLPRSPLVLPNGLSAASGAALADFALIRSYDPPPIASPPSSLNLSSGDAPTTPPSLEALLALARAKPAVPGGETVAPTDGIRTAAGQEAFFPLFNDALVDPFGGASRNTHQGPNSRNNGSDNAGAPPGNSGGTGSSGGGGAGNGASGDAIAVRSPSNTNPLAGIPLPVNGTQASQGQTATIQTSTTTSLSVKPILTSAGGLSYVATATVRGTTGVPTGTVEFVEGNVLGKVGLDGTGTATLMLSAQNVDLAGLTAVYLGDGVNAPSTAGVSGMPPTPAVTQTAGIGVSPALTSATTSNLVFTPGAVTSDPTVRYQVQVNGFQANLSPTGVNFIVGANGASVPMTFGGQAGIPTLTGVKPVGGGFGEVDYTGVYKGIDLKYYSNAQNQLEYDWIVAPGASPNLIRMDFAPSANLSIDGSGNLLMSGSGGGLTEYAPQLYQTINGGRQTVTGRFVLDGAHEVGFLVGTYDHALPLVIDPVLSGTLSYVGDWHGYYLDSAGFAIGLDFNPVGSFVSHGDSVVTWTLVSSGLGHASFSPPSDVTLTDFLISSRYTVFPAGSTIYLTWPTNTTSPSVMNDVAWSTSPPASTTTTVSSSSSTSTSGQSITFTATVSGSGGSGAPTGTVTFKDGSTVLGPGTLSTTGGVTTASYSTAALSAGSHTITAVYNGDSNFPTSTGSTTQAVAALSIISLAAVATGSGHQVQVTGQVIGDTESGDFVSVSGVVAGETTTGAGGYFSFMGTASGLGIVNASAENQDLDDSDLVSTTLSVPAPTINNFSVTYGANNSATLTGTVSAGQPGGLTVSFSGVLSGSVTTNANGTFSYTTTASQPGVVYAQTTDVWGQQSNQAQVTLTSSPSTTTTVSSSSSTSTYGQSVTFTATVSGSGGSGSPTGTVTFKDGSTVLGPGTLSTTGGVTTASYSTAALSAGNHTITAEYGGDSIFPTSTGSTAQAVGKAPLTVTADNQSMVYGNGSAANLRRQRLRQRSGQERANRRSHHVGDFVDRGRDLHGCHHAGDVERGQLHHH